jgi:hypothetical protein
MIKDPNSDETVAPVRNELACLCLAWSEELIITHALVNFPRNKAQNDRGSKAVCVRSGFVQFVAAQSTAAKQLESRVHGQTKWPKNIFLRSSSKPQLHPPSGKTLT